MIDILEVGALNPGDVTAICVLETDVKVDFERPLDYVDEKQDEKMSVDSSSTIGRSVSENIFKSTTKKIDIQNDVINGGNSSSSGKTSGSTDGESAGSGGDQFKAFAGVGRRIDGRVPKAGTSPSVGQSNSGNEFGGRSPPITSSNKPPSYRSLKENSSAAHTDQNSPLPKTSSPSSSIVVKRELPKEVYKPGDASSDNKKSKEGDVEESKDVDHKDTKTFSGKGRSLRG